MNETNLLKILSDFKRDLRAGNIKVSDPRLETNVEKTLIRLYERINSLKNPTYIHGTEDINDDDVSVLSTWSSKKIYDMIKAINDNEYGTSINDNSTSDTTTWSSKKIYDTIKKLIDEIPQGGGTVVQPFTVTLTANPTIVELGTSTRITLNWSYSDEIDSQTLNGATLTNTLRTTSYTPSQTTTYTLSAKKKGDSTTASKSVTVNVVGASYYGIVNTVNPTEATIKSLTKSVKANKSLTYSSINLSNNKVCYAYPTSFGVLNSIKDGNGFEYINSYTRNTLTIDGINYYVYVLTDSTTIDNFRQIFS